MMQSIPPRDPRVAEVVPHVWIADEYTYTNSIKDTPGWFALLAAKEPFHREALGYTGRGAPKEHPEYLYAYRTPVTLILNMVDAPKPDYFPTKMIQEALHFMYSAYLDPQTDLYSKKDLVVVCNQAKSRSPSLVLLLLAHLGLIPVQSYAQARSYFTHEIYPFYEPGDGIAAHLEQHWTHYIDQSTAKLGRAPQSQR